jgi:GT2 family glycosyltransferase
VPTLSVVIPAYNAAGTIDASARSAATQEGVDVDVIVVDDGSRDDTAAVAGAIAGVTVIRQPNAGPAAARNTGIRAAHGSYIAFLDADDRLLPGWACAVIDLLETGAQIAVADVLIADAASGETVSRYSQEVDFPAAHDQRRRVLEENFLPSTACLARATVEATGGFDESLRGVEDWDLWIRIITAGGRAARDERALSVYARGHASVSSDRLGMARQEIALLRKCAALPLDLAAERARRRSLRSRGGRLHLLLGDTEAAAGRRTAALRYARAAIELHQPRLLVRSAATAAAPRFAAAHGSRARQA